MTTTTAGTAGSADWPRTGWVLTGIAALFLTFDTVIKLARLPPAVDGTVALGYPAHLVAVIGVIELVCLVLYLVPPTRVLGALFLTGYLGGAIATHVRIGSPLPSHTLFPIYVALLVWGGLYLRDGRLRALLPVQRRG
jgi:DoxX-like protein